MDLIKLFKDIFIGNGTEEIPVSRIDLCLLKPLQIFLCIPRTQSRMTARQSQYTKNAQQKKADSYFIFETFFL